MASKSSAITVEVATKPSILSFSCTILECMSAGLEDIAKIEVITSIIIRNK